MDEYEKELGRRKRKEWLEKAERRLFYLSLIGFMVFYMFKFYER